MGKIRFTDEQIAILSKDPNIRDIRPDRLRFNLEFRQEIYDAVKDDIRSASISEYLRKRGYTILAKDYTVVTTLRNTFLRNGRPKNQNRSSSKLYNHDKADDESLLETGLFEKKRNGISFTDEFIEELYSAYPEQTIEEGIRKAGIDPDLVGYQRMFALKQRFDDSAGTHIRSVIYSAEDIRKYSTHPYVQKITARKFKLKECFYNDAMPISFKHINDILTAFEFEPSMFSTSTRNRILYKLRSWKRTECKPECIDDQVIRIQKNVLQILSAHTEQVLSDLKDVIPSLSKPVKKRLFQDISDLQDYGGRNCTTRSLLEKLGVSKSCYYHALKNEKYGNSCIMHEKKDEERRQLIQQVLDYKGFRKGYRQVYMMMERITGQKMGRNTVMRIMRKYHMHTGIRKPSNNRRAAREQLEKNCKDNLLNRRFRLSEPREVLESDVTYLFYDHDRKRMYGSACKDPLTGILHDFSVSERNDLELAMRTLDNISTAHPQGAIFHTDQGILYLSDSFQKKAEEYGFRQSMSKRGNCWDNAPQESFFGHFKDEVSLDTCTTPEEVRMLVSGYIDYYNNERPQWNLNRMTPVEYEKYLLEMSEDERQARIEKEERRYQDMKENARLKAIERYKTLGV